MTKKHEKKEPIREPVGDDGHVPAVLNKDMIDKGIRMHGQLLKSIENWRGSRIILWGILATILVIWAAAGLRSRAGEAEPL